MPASADAKKDREIFLKILTMDDDGTRQRCKGKIPAAAWREAVTQLCFRRPWHLANRLAYSFAPNTDAIKQKATFRWLSLPSACTPDEFWLLDLGSNQGPTD
jgi:hypothetical protein